MEILLWLLIFLAGNDIGKKPCWADSRELVSVRGDICPPMIPPLEELPIRLSWYDPAHCYDGDGSVVTNINCDGDPGHLAGMTPVTPDLYGVTASCIPDWFNEWIYVPQIGWRHCLDTGGAIIPTWGYIFVPGGSVWMWYIPVDVLATEEEWWNYTLAAPGEWQLGGGGN